VNRIAIDRAGNQTTVTVTRWPNEEAPLQISTSAPAAGISALPGPLKRAINKRNQRGGAAKGRVLYAEQLGLPGRRITVGALILHITERDEPEILNLGVADFKVGRDRRQLIATMLTCVVSIAIECDSRSVSWLVHGDKEAKAATAFEFRRLPQGRSPRGTIRLRRKVQKLSGRLSAAG
jgi:hypothetical protein